MIEVKNNIDNDKKEKVKIKKNRSGLNILIITFLLIFVFAIAVIGTRDVFRKYRVSKTKEIALLYIDSIRNILTENKSLSTGIFYFQADVLKNKKLSSPMGGKFRFDNPLHGQIGSFKVEKSAPFIYKVVSNPLPKCYANAYSFVEISNVNDEYVYKICLTAGYERKYVLGLESEIKDKDNIYVIKY